MICDDCKKEVSNLTDIDSEKISVCEDCLNNYVQCEGCSEWFTELVTQNLCEVCLEDYQVCDDCGEYFYETTYVSSCDSTVCDDCLYENYSFCEECGEWFYCDDYNHDQEMCNSCAEDCYNEDELIDNIEEILIYEREKPFPIDEIKRWRDMIQDHDYGCPCSALRKCVHKTCEYNMDNEHSCIRSNLWQDIAQALEYNDHCANMLVDGLNSIIDDIIEGMISEVAEGMIR